MKYRKKKRILKFTVMFIFLFFVFISGFVIVDKNTRAIGFGDHSPFFSLNECEEKYELEINLMGKTIKSNLIDVKSIENIKSIFDKKKQ